jgi:protein O-GlcNAc transferase
MALFEKGQWDEAITALSAAVKAQPKDARAWKALGVAYATRKNYELAEPNFRRACELDAKLPDACYYHGRALYALNQFDASLEALDRASAVQPRSWRVRLARAQSLEAAGRAPEAEKQFTESLALSRGADPQPGTAFGLFLIRQGRVAEAIAPLEEVVKRFPSETDANIHLGRALVEQGRNDAAIARFEQALAASPGSGQAHLLLAKALVRAGRSTEAQPHFQAAAGSVE